MSEKMKNPFMFGLSLLGEGTDHASINLYLNLHGKGSCPVIAYINRKDETRTREVTMDLSKELAESFYNNRERACRNLIKVAHPDFPESESDAVEDYTKEYYTLEGGAWMLPALVMEQGLKKAFNMYLERGDDQGLLEEYTEILEKARTGSQEQSQ